MSLLSFESYPLVVNAIVFAVAAAGIWIAGTALERYADALSGRTGLGQAFTGVLLLSAATSLPEVATTFTAVWLLNNPTLAVYNLLGGVALQTAILAIADRTQRQSGALTSFEPRFLAPRDSKKQRNLRNGASWPEQRSMGRMAHSSFLITMPRRSIARFRATTTGRAARVKKRLT